MDILFQKTRFEKECNDHSLLVRRYGQKQASLIRRRLDELRAAQTLADIRCLPGPRCHELKGNRAGQLSVDLDGPYRLIFRPANDPVPVNESGGLDWARVSAILVLKVEDTHG